MPPHFDTIKLTFNDESEITLIRGRVDHESRIVTSFSEEIRPIILAYYPFEAIKVIEML